MKVNRRFRAAILMILILGLLSVPAYAFYSVVSIPELPTKLPAKMDSEIKPIDFL